MKDLHKTISGRCAIPVLILTAIVLVAVSDTSANTGQGSAIGFIIGDPTGFSWRVGTGTDNSLAGAVGFSSHDHLQAHVDYLWHSTPFENQNLGVSYGVGGAAGFGRDRDTFGGFNHAGHDHDNAFGVRIPVGLTYLIPESPVELLLELAPLIVVVPSSGIGLNGGIGARILL